MGAVQEMIYQSSGLVLDTVVGFSTLFLFKWGLMAKTALGRFASGVNNGTKGLVNKAQERAQETPFYQRRKLSRDFRKQERSRAGTEDFAQKLEDSPRWRRRAAGTFNRAGQQRAEYSAQEIRRKARREESQRAAQQMLRSGLEGDVDLEGIARHTIGSTFTSATHTDASGRPSSIVVTEAARQAAIEGLMQQSRIKILRGLEADGGGRGPGGSARTELHKVLDDAYEQYGSAIKDKAPDLLPNRRASEGKAAFTDLQPEDTAGWHSTTYDTSERYYQTAPAGAVERRQMLGATAAAMRSPAMRSKFNASKMESLRAIVAANPGAASATDEATMKAMADELKVTWP